MCKFQVGQTVRLNSGSPEMTIIGIKQVEGKCIYTCKWFHNLTEPKEEEFIEDSLVLDV